MNNNNLNLKKSNDLLLIEELKQILSAHSGDENVLAALGQALRDGFVTPQELAHIRAAVALSLVQKHGGFEVFIKQTNDKQLLAEIAAIRERFEPDSEPIKVLEEVLKDGFISKKELDLLRAVTRDAKLEQSHGPSVNVAIPRPPRLDLPGRVKKVDDEDDE